MRITVVMGFFLPVPALAGGATEKIWGRMAQEFAAAGHDVTVVSRSWPGLPDRERNGRRTHLRVPGMDHTRSLVRNLWRDFLWSRRVTPLLPPGDVVVCNTVNLPIRLKEKRPDAGRVVVVLGRMPKGQVRVYGQVDLILATSGAVAAKALRENPALAAKIALFTQPIDWQLHARGANASASSAPVTLGYVGRIHPEKGLETLLEACVRLRRNHPALPRWTLSLVGPVAVDQGGGGPQYLRSLQNRYGSALGDALQVRPPCFDVDALARIYGSLRVFCYPSLAARGEGLSIAPLEAMAAGAVPVLSQLECYRDFLEPDVNGFQFDHTRPDAAGPLADILRRLIEDTEMRTRMSARAQSSARNYDYGTTVPDLLAQFARLTASIPKN